MDKIKKILSMLLLVMVCFNSTIPVSANDTNEPLVIYFNDFKFELEDYDSRYVYVEYQEDNVQEIALIKDINTDEILETITVQRTLTMARTLDNVYAYILTRDTVHGGTIVRLSIHVELYSSGSFRQINSVQNKDISIATSVTDTVIEDKIVSVWSEGNVFPTTALLYAYSGTLCATIDTSVGAEISVELEAALLNAGFSYSTSVGSTKYYRLSISNSGEISLY